MSVLVQTPYTTVKTVEFTEMIPQVISPRWTEAIPLSFELPDLSLVENLALPDEDGEPMENQRERIQINLGIESLYQEWTERADFFVGGNMFLYYSLTQARQIFEELNTSGYPKRAFRGPDMFVALDVDGNRQRQKWVVWEEDGRYPNVIFEFLSPSTRKADLNTKKKLYEQTFATREYFCFDYLHPNKEDSLLGWRLDAQGHYQPITADSRGWLWSETLELWVGRWSGEILRDRAVWLRFYRPNGQLVLTPAEAERQRAESAQQRAESERQRAESAEAEVARLKALLAQQH